MAVTQLITAEQFLEMPNDCDKRHELVEGELFEAPELDVTHVVIILALVRSLGVFVAERDLGEVMFTGLRHIISREPDSVRVPDGSFIAKGRIPIGAFDNYVPLVPDLVIEIVSHEDLAEYLHDKVLEYLEAGARLIWVIWPKSGTVSVYKLDKTSRELGYDDHLDGEDVLPGFQMRVAELFKISLAEYKSLFTEEDSTWQQRLVRRLAASPAMQ